MSEKIDRILAQLRHAYAQLAAESVVYQKTFADGLIAPAIRELETLRKVLNEAKDSNPDPS